MSGGDPTARGELVVSAMNERADYGAATRASGVSEEGAEARVTKILEGALEAFGPNSSEEARAEAADKFRELQLSDENLRELMALLAPKGMNPDLWRRWLGGGSDPFHGMTLRRLSIVAPTRPKTNAKLSSGRVRNAEKELADAEAAVERARANLAHMKALDSALVHVVVSEQISKLLEATFAMGPAWTIMRAVSAYLSLSQIAEATRDLPNEVARRNAEDRAIAVRQSHTNEMLDALDLWCGDERFEEELRGAILQVVRQFAHLAPAHDGEGRRSRSRAAQKTSIRESARAASDAVIEGLKRPGAA